MTQGIFPEVQAASEALKTRIALTEAEIAEMLESIKAKKQLVRAWRKAIAAVIPELKSKARKSLDAAS